MSTDLIAAIQNPDVFDHPVTHIELIETHISWVVLTGEFVYKIKKPVDFGFLDFTTLDKRKHFCEEELRLNQRLAPELYLEVVTITGTPGQPRINGEGAALEYAIKARQFPQENLFDRLQERNELTSGHIRSLGKQIAEFHLNIEKAAPETRFGTPEHVYAPVKQNFEQIRPMLETPDQLSQLDYLEQWAQSSFERLHAVFEQRKRDGFVRECHGDIHLGNVTLYQNKVILFDCIEFNDDFRWTDVASDLAFILMDLQFRGLTAFARQLLAQYLEITGDFEALDVLRFYKAYRAMVRAKIALFTRGNPGLTEEERASLLATYRQYANLAESYSTIPDRVCLVGQGVCGSGKSTVGAILNEQFGAIPIRSDVERKRLFNLGPYEASGSSLNGGIYSSEASEKTYRRLEYLTERLLRAGYPVFVDATNLRRAHRQRFEAIAEQLGVPGILVSCQTDEATIRRWIEQRTKAGGDTSEAGIDVLEKQLQSLEPLSEEEQRHAIVVDVADPASLETLVACIRRRLGQGQD